jgi:AraC-like DNA-binding protein
MRKSSEATAAKEAVRWQADHDVLATVLRSLRVQGSVFCRAAASAPWGLALEAQNFAHFHVMEKGNAWLRLKGQKNPEPLREGDLAVIPHGKGHALTDAPTTNPVPLSSLSKPGGPSGLHRILRFGGGGEAARLVCGAFRFGPSIRHPLLQVLPPAILVRGSAGRPAPWLEPILAFLGDEAGHDQPGAETVISRLTDVIFVQAVRTWMESQPQTDRGWLGALRDPQIGQALSLIHSDPRRAWSVSTLAARVAMSRSPFSARFAALVGEGPLSYLRRWRLQLASDLLAREPLTVAQVAAKVGYQSEASLSRAFHRELGVSPAAYRRRESIGTAAR